MNQLESGIRSYGPGKFDTILDSYVYDVSLNGCDDELGESDTFGWFGLMRNGSSILEAIIQDDDFTDEERDLLNSSAGVIVDENSQGFVGVTYYDTEKELDDAWAMIVKEYEEWESGESEEMEDE